MVDAKIDRRILKTKKAIRTALIELLATQALDSISITAIAKAAHITRKTFYIYYANVQDVVAEIEADIVTAFEQALNKVTIGDHLEDAHLIFETLTQVINNDFHDYQALVTAHNLDDTQLIRKITDCLKKRLIKITPSDYFNNEQTFMLTVNYVLAGIMSVYQEWFHNSQAISIEVLSQQLSTLTMSGVAGILKVS
ncbi:MAG: TetR/AcrR family transcriptional regulator [Lactobacillus sp.]|jgi:AcrR family transcriptional regulator|nr:TetR/AcrR family transcriptional regulator [Lactobacillus sp.]